MGNKLRNLFAVVVATLALVLTPALVFASSTPNLTQTVNAGALTTNIFQSDDATPVASPSVAFSAVNKAFTCQTSTATLGDTNNKVNVTNLATNNGWTLTMAATGGASAVWDDGASHTYSYNTAAGTGCTSGQLTVNPSVGTITTDCSSTCDGVTVTKGSSTAYVSGTADSVTLMSSASGSAWGGYLTGVGLSQKIPASQESGNYSLGMTVTVTAQ
jgi:hypothetical protein